MKRKIFHVRFIYPDSQALLILQHLFAQYLIYEPCSPDF